MQYQPAILTTTTAYKAKMGLTTRLMRIIDRATGKCVAVAAVTRDDTEAERDMRIAWPWALNTERYTLQEAYGD